MRLIDLAQPYLDGVHTIVEVAAGELDLSPYLRDAGEITYLRCRPGEDLPAIGKGVMLVLSAGPDPLWHLPFAACREILAQVEDGGRGLVLFGHAGADLPYHEILDTLVARRCQVLQAATLDYTGLRCGIAFAQAEDVQAPPDYFGRPVPAATRAGARDVALRISSEYVLDGFVSRAQRARQLDAAQPAETAGAAGIAITAGITAADVDGETTADGDGETAADENDEEAVQASAAVRTADRERLARALRDAEQQLATAQERLAAVEGSLAVQVGRQLSAVIRSPWHRGRRLPRQLYRMWRRRRAGKAGSGNVRAGQPGRASAARSTSMSRVLAGRGVPGPGWPSDAPARLVVAGVLTPRTCATLSPDALVYPLLPHDTDALDGTGADVVIVDSAATLAGGPWSYIGDAAATDRNKRLADLIGIARSLGIPVVFLRSLPSHRAPGLELIAASCDAVFDGGLGVQLARFNPVDLDPDRSCDPVYTGRRDPREDPAIKRLLDALLAAPPGGPATADRTIRVVADIGWDAEPGWYRRHGLFVTASPRQAREQLACGARVVVAAPQQARAQQARAQQAAAQQAGRELAVGAAVVTGAAAAASQIAAERALGVREPGEIRTLLRDIFTTHATPVRLAELARLVGAAADPLAGRQVTVAVRWPGSGGAGAEVSVDDDAARLAGALLRQRHRPSEVVLAASEQGPPPDRVPAGMHELTDAGIGVRLAVEPGVPGAARAARTGWVVRWDAARAYPDPYILDLVCAQECARADAVGYAAGAEYVFAPEIEPALIRGQLLRSGELSAGAWGRRGHTLFSISGRH